MKTALSGSSTMIAARDVVSTNLDDEVAILNVTSGMYYGLNPVGARVWALIQEQRTVDEIRQRILATYDVDEHTCEADLLALLADMARAGLIEARDAGA